MDAAHSSAPSRRPQTAAPETHELIGYRCGNGAHRRRSLTPVAVLPGQTSIRLLCRGAAIGGVIGRSGVIVKQLERETGARIRVGNVVTDCEERVISVIGSAACERRATLRGAGEEEGEECAVSQAQEALLRVYDRALEVEARSEGGGGGMTSCRLLAVSAQIGAVMGKGGKIIEKMRNDSGAKIRILPPEQIPACSSPGDELIQVTVVWVSLH